MSIIKPDPYMDLYAAHKQMEPEAKIMARAFERRHVEAVDALVELAHGSHDLVQGEGDWKVIEALINFWAKQFPDEYNSFKDSVGSIRDYKGEGMSRTREIRHVGSIPSRLMNIIKAIFPSQSWDKRFSNKFVKRFALFKVGDESKGSVSITV